MLLCQAQKIFGNRWTEIAKVVSGRTDNAVKNRFSTLSKKRVKNEASTKENNTSYITANNKRTRFQNVLDTLLPPSKIKRKHIPDTQDCKLENELTGTFRPLFDVHLQNCQNVNTFTTPVHAKSEEVLNDGTFLKKDDPKVIALMQQAELLTSLALKVNTEKTDESYENACKAVQDFLKQSKESYVLGFNVFDMDFQLESIKDLVENIRSCDEVSQHSWRQLDLYQGSPDGSEYSTGSTVLSQVIEKIEHQETQNIQPDNVDAKSIMIPDLTTNQDIIVSCDEFDHDVGDICPLPNSLFNSPIQVTPLFRSLAAGIPSPQFSESERNFLLKTLGMESSPLKPDTRA